MQADIILSVILIIINTSVLSHVNNYITYFISLSAILLSFYNIYKIKKEITHA